MVCGRGSQGIVHPPNKCTAQYSGSLGKQISCSGGVRPGGCAPPECSSGAARRVWAVNRGGDISSVTPSEERSQ